MKSRKKARIRTINFVDSRENKYLRFEFLFPNSVSVGNLHQIKIFDRYCLSFYSKFPKNKYL